MVGDKAGSGRLKVTTTRFGLGQFSTRPLRTVPSTHNGKGKGTKKTVKHIINQEYEMF